MRKITLHTLMLIIVWQLSLKSFGNNSKLYIATNKESYLPAESIQFEIFLLNTTNAYSAAYVELLDCKGKGITKKMLPFHSNSCWGHIDIPENDDSEFYILYCYVLGSDNIQSDCFKKIFISNQNFQTIKESGKEFRLNYFFEGGSFVADIPNTLLIHITDEDGDAVSVEGKITDENNIFLGKFVTNEMGLARLIINPKFLGQYFIVADNKKGCEIRTKLPVAGEYGVSMSITKNNDSLTYYVFSYAEDEKQIDYKLEIVSDSEIVYKSAINFKAGVSFVQENINSKILPPGFLIFRITDKENKFYAKRIVYNNYDSNSISTLTIVDTIGKKIAKVTIPSYVNGSGYLNIRIKDKSDTHLPTENLKNPVPESESGTEITFNDFLISCNEIPLKHFSKNLNTDSLLTLCGIAYNSQNEILQHKKLNLVFQYKNLKKDFLVTTTDYYGKFEIKGLEFYDTLTVYYQLADKSDKKNTIRVDFSVTPDQSYTHEKILLNDFTCSAKTENTDSVNKKNQENVYAKSLEKKEKTLTEVTVRTGKQKEITDSEKYADKYISGANNQSNFMSEGFDFIANPQTVDNISVLNFLKGRMPSLEISVSSSGDIFISDHTNGIGVYLDDVNITQDLGLIGNLMVSEVALVRYYSLPLKPRSDRTKTKYDNSNPLVIANDAGGDLMIYTKKSLKSSTQNIKGLGKARIVGYDLNTLSIPDNSPSFYWKPNWAKQKEQTIYIGLPTDNTQKEIQLIIEGINPAKTLYTFTKKLVFN